MSANLMELVFVLDRSGSMHGKEADTIGGYNAILEEQKGITSGNALVTLVLFDDEIQYLYERKPIQYVSPLTSKQYFVRGCTALYDAVGSTIERIIDAHINTAKEKRPDRVLFVVATDGRENSSHKYNASMVRQMIQLEREKFAWQFLFLGANLDAEEVAESIGISRDCAATFETENGGMKACMDGVRQVVHAYRNCEYCKPLETVLEEMSDEMTDDEMTDDEMTDDEMTDDEMTNDDTRPKFMAPMMCACPAPMMCDASPKLSQKSPKKQKDRWRKLFRNDSNNNQ